MKIIVWVLVGLLIIFHHDFWNWENDTLLLGFIPYGLAYHVGLSLACSLVWLFACTFAWPKGVDDYLDDHESGGEA